MSSQNSPDPGRGIVVQKPKADIYTALLVIALVAVLLAIGCLWAELSRYKYDYKATGATATVSYLAPQHDIYELHGTPRRAFPTEPKA